MRITRSIIPNLFTLVNLFMGFNALVYISKDELHRAAVYVLIAGIFDMLDGIVARLTKSTSEFGVELDSLCDAVSFGVVPSYMLYHVFFYQFKDFGILMASLPALAGVTRLARFNVNVTGFEDKKYFTGLAIPSGAMVIISYILFFNQYFTGIQQTVMMFLISAGTSLAMVSKIKFDNMPRPTKKAIKNNPLLFIIFTVGLIGCIVTKGWLIFPFMVFYLLVSTARFVYWWFKRKWEVEDEIDESDEPENMPYNMK